MVTQQVKESEQLYMLEFLIYHLNLSSEKIELIKSSPLSIHLNFLDFDKFIINQEEFSKKPVIDNAIDFGSGESCVFSKKPRDLMNHLRTEPLIIEVHKSDADPCPKELEVICKTEIHLTACFCQIEMAMMNPSKLPEPYTVRDTYDLIDRDNKPSGTIELFLRLSCLGESIVTHFHVNDKSFLFKNMNSADEFSCVKLPQNEEEVNINKFWTPKSKIINIDERPEAKTIVGISSVCDDLVKQDPRPIPSKLPPKAPEEHSEIPLQPKIHEDEPPIMENQKIRQISDSRRFLSPRKFPCGGKVCSGGLCSSLPLLKEDLRENNFERNIYASRGSERRLRGGNDEKCSTYPVEAMQALIPGLCRSFLPEEETQPGCGCFGKLGHYGKAKKPCFGIDCLITSFREAEKFVDSIGRVPGMAGLGLMDPTESPYFGRYRPRPLPKLAERRFNQNQNMPMTKSSSIFRRSRKFPPSQMEQSKTSATALRKWRKDEGKEGKPLDDQAWTTEEPEMGPCGEPICKSRKKIHKTASEFSSKETVKLTKSKRTSRSLDKRKNSGRLNAKKVKNLRNYERNYSHVKVGKRVMRMVEAGSQRGCFGHRSCVEIRARVPGNMGWLWNTNNMPGNIRPKIGWKPGAISRHLWRILEQAKIGKDIEGIEERPVTPIKGKKGKLTKSKSLLSVTRSQRKKRENENEHELPPTLHIHRKNGDYYVTMYPVKAENFNQPELQEDVKPLQFKVTKDKNGDADSVQSSSIGDDMEIEFSPPSALQKYKKIPARIDLETQVVQQEILDAFKGTSTTAAKKKKGGKK